jgi:hypothetical protein
MGVRASIIVHRADGKWKRVYCHWGVEAGERGPRDLFQMP